MIEFDDEFEVPAPPAAVMRNFMDVEQVARCVPGVTLNGRDEEGNYLGTMAVSFGPKRVKFDGKLRCEFDAQNHTGVLTGGGMAARAAAVKIRTEFHVSQSPRAAAGAPASLVRISSRADLQGVLAQFAATGGAVLAKQVMQEFAANLTRQLAPGSSDSPSQQTASPDLAARPGSQPSISAGGLLWRTLVAWLKSAWPFKRRSA